MKKIAFIFIMPLTLLLAGCNYHGGYYYDSYSYSVPNYGWYDGYYRYDYGYYGDGYRYRYARPYNYRYNRGYNRPYPRPPVGPGRVGPVPKNRPSGFVRPAAPVNKMRPMPSGGFNRPMMAPRQGVPIRSAPGRAPAIKNWR